MANYYLNTMKVYGNEKDLRRFKNDMFGEEKLCINDHSHFKKLKWNYDLSNGYSYSLKVDLIDKEDQLVFQFSTKWFEPERLYDELIENYKKLNFEIYAVYDSASRAVEIATSGGEYIKYNFLEGHSVDLIENIYMTFHSVEDALKDNKITITNAEIIRHEKGKSLATNTSGSKISDCETMSTEVSTGHLDDDELLAELDKMDTSTILDVDIIDRAT